jgi:hypothetical protein
MFIAFSPPALLLSLLKTRLCFHGARQQFQTKLDRKCIDATLPERLKKERKELTAVRSSFLSKEKC